MYALRSPVRSSASLSDRSQRASSTAVSKHCQRLRLSKCSCLSDPQDHSLLLQLQASGPHLDTLADRSRTNEPNTTSNSEATRLQLSRLAVASAQPTGRLDGQSYQPQQQQQLLPQRPERLPRCSTVSLQTELATPSLVVFSGGTAFNSVAGPLRRLTTQVSHVLPVSDDGGSTAEIVRVIGGPAVGDIRSRCLRLADDRDEEARAVKRLLAHRLPGGSSLEAKMEWYSIVEGAHPMWGGVSEPYKHMIRAFLVHFQLQILSQVSQEREFNFKNGSIGNFFFAGARTFFRSLESAVFLFSRVARIPHGSTVLPAICTEEVITLGAELEDGTVIRGQNNISHPDTPSSSSGPDSAGPSAVDKLCCAPLPSPVRRVFYLSREGTGQEHEVSPPPNPRVLTAIQGCDAVVYGMGSLYTSICPTLILEGVGEAIAARQDALKVLLLNGSHDRETSTSGFHSGAMRASDVVTAVTDALNRRRSRPREGHHTAPLKHPPSAYITTLLTPKGGPIEIDREALQLLGITQVLEVASSTDADGRVVYDPEELVLAIGQLILGQQTQPSTPAAAAAAAAEAAAAASLAS